MKVKINGYQNVIGNAFPKHMDTEVLIDDINEMIFTKIDSKTDETMDVYFEISFDNYLRMINNNSK